MSETRFSIIPEVHLILQKNDKFLMLRRFQTGYMDGHYSLVAGHVDGNETFRSAMAREALEEAGIVVNPENLELVHTMHRNSDFERLSLFFRSEVWEGEIRNMEPHKCDDLGWYSLKEQNSGLIPYVKFAFENISQDIIYSEFGWNRTN